jgi:FixJ family two-component response regulator
MAKRPKVAIVDDDASVREATVSLVRAAGLSTEAFDSAGDFLKSERCGGADCLVADVHMPGTSGLELHGCLVEGGRSIPTVLITAYPDEAVRRRALKAGVAAYLTKPFTDSELLESIHSAIAQHKPRSKNG